MADFFSRLRGGGGASGLEADLRRITDSDNIDVLKEKEVLMSIVQASHSADDRREIMKHLRVCLAEQASKYWRRVYGGLVLVEQLLQRGSRALMTETAEGHHFDLVQRLTFLSNFEYSEDKRVQAMVRQKASFLRTEVIARMENSGDSPAQSLSAEDAAALVNTDGALRSPAGNQEKKSSPVLPSASAKSFSSEMPMPLPAPSKGPMTLNGIVTVGHRDDTTSESSGAEDASARKGGAGKKKEKPRGKSNGYVSKDNAPKRQVLNDSTDSDSPSEDRRTKREQRTTPSKAAQTQPASPPAAPAAQQTVDLLDMFEPTAVETVAAPAAQTVDLL